MRPTLCLSLLIILVLAATIGAVRHEPDPAQNPAADESITTTTYNIHQYWSTEQTGQHNPSAVRDVLQAAGADLVGLQETEGGRVTSGNLAGVRWLAHQLDMHHAPGPSAREGIYGIALLSTWPILETTYRPLPAAHSVERGVLIATIDHPDGPITAAVTHLAVIDEARERARQAQALVDLLEPRDNVILLGDFNTPPDHGDDAYAILDSAYDDAWSLAGNTRESGPTQLDQDPGQRIDHIWLRGTWQVGSCHTSGTPEASDHRAVTCSISRETR